MSYQMPLPQVLVDLVNQFNPDHRDQMYTSLVEIVLKNCCHLCRARCDQNENCIKPTSVVFCNNNCMQFWLAQNDYFQNYDEANDFELEADGGADDDAADDGADDDVDDDYNKQIYDYIDRHVYNPDQVAMHDPEQVYDYVDRHGDFAGK